MLQDVLVVLKDNLGTYVESHDIKIGSRTRNRSLKQFRRFVDQKHPMVNGYHYDFKVNYVHGNCNPKAIIYWYCNSTHNSCETCTNDTPCVYRNRINPYVDRVLPNTQQESIVWGKQ